ncbi:hypothetical protein DASC09_017420 [Saccharomycopsis crataegensis]|uniref:Uncharacterized protein n=1 Tax=Saccharomycopsis crataegensis TaxID=43959 RepID=A0AAV5QII1_9ASCO|nr:hypothetical protein DASC09_017420 [Saccharomycopsis crataegensis]
MDFKKEFTDIKKASNLINITLQSKGFLQVADDNSTSDKLNGQKLLFCSVDYHSLMEFDIAPLMFDNTDQDETLIRDKLKKTMILNEKLVNNDKNVINVLYSLLKNLEDSKDQKSQFLEKLKDKDSEIKSLQSENRHLTKQLAKQKSVNVETSVSFQVQSQLMQANKLRIHEDSLELKKLQNTIKSLKSHHQIELRRKDVEISNLKDKLLGKDFSYSASSNNSKDNNSCYTMLSQGTPNLDFDDPIQVPATNKFSQRPLVNGVFDKEMEKLMVDSSDLITNLTLANGENLEIITKTKNYLQVLDNYLRLLISNLKNMANNDEEENEILSRNLNLTKPSSPIVFFEDKTNGDSSNMTHHDSNTTIEVTNTLINLSTIGEVQNQLMNNLTRLHGTVESLIEYNTGDTSGPSNSKSKEEVESLKIKVKELKSELSKVKQNWQSAIDTMEDWKNYRNQQNNNNSSSSISSSNSVE